MSPPKYNEIVSPELASWKVIELSQKGRKRDEHRRGNDGHRGADRGGNVDRGAA
jgi:hypothetical protein